LIFALSWLPEGLKNRYSKEFGGQGPIGKQVGIGSDSFDQLAGLVDGTS
jgi:hypothetical protein